MKTLLYATSVVCRKLQNRSFTQDSLTNGLTNITMQGKCKRVNFTLEQAMKAQMGVTAIALLFLQPRR